MAFGRNWVGLLPVNSEVVVPPDDLWTCRASGEGGCPGRIGRYLGGTGHDAAHWAARPGRELRHCGSEQTLTTMAASYNAST